MPPFTRTTLLVAAVTLAGCGADRIGSPPALTRSALLERAPASEATPDFSTIDVPGALATSPQGINAAGDVSGSYVDANHRSHGFVLRGGSFTTIDYPGADGTNVEGIGPDGDVVGTHWLNSEEGTAFHGFRRTRDGSFESVHYTSHLYEIPQRVLPDGTVLGCRHDHDLMGSMRGIAIGRADTSENGAFASMNNGATPDHRLIVGLYTNMMMGRQEGFTMTDGVFTPLVIPGSLSTAAWDVNPAGEIVGVYRNAAGAHGFVMNTEGYRSIDYPGATATRVFGINARGDVTGAYVAGGVTHGFVARRTQGNDR
jgi:hypothetical protein